MVTKGTQNILDYWKRRKELMLKGFGSKCQICGYDRCQKALEFHHLDPNEKEITLSRSIYSWETTKNELKNKILFLRPIIVGSKPEIKLEHKFPTECKLTINPQNAYSSPLASRIKGNKEPTDNANIPFII